MLIGKGLFSFVRTKRTDLHIQGKKYLRGADFVNVNQTKREGSLLNITLDPWLGCKQILKCRQQTSLFKFIV